MVKIWQIFYDERSKNSLDSAFTPYDNSKPDKEDEYEYGVMRKLYLSNQLFDEKSKYAGVLSWKFKEKTGLDGKKFLNWINQNKGYDVYFANPYPEFAALNYNPWHHGEYLHPGIMEIAEKLLKEAGLDFDIRNGCRTGAATLCFCNYWVATKEFWYVYMEHCEKLYNAIQNTDAETKRLLFDERACMRIDCGLFAFIMERMFSTILSTYQFKTIGCFGVKSFAHRNQHLKQMLDFAAPIVQQIDAKKHYTPETIKIINSFGELYHDTVFFKKKPFEEYAFYKLVQQKKQG